LAAKNVQIYRCGQQFDCVVSRYHRRQAMHEVEWTVEDALADREQAVKRKVWVDFAGDIALEEITSQQVS
jgi:hypothetical protein